MSSDFSGLKRDSQTMPADVAEALAQRNLMADDHARPTYQQNDYLGWISRAKQAATRQKRLDQMLSELAQGCVYMGMRHAPSVRS
ncbi:YdeI/OmpD-associated family protein [Chitinolyticbacter meiyuanensis]|uniref:YdeI/OmpD-associated family protein n=1 Tax=Chitinolyticbacter meiyuanensis TaxID=682798 RepID=UPI0011E5A4A3|nr:YdeI/OmpD-associated family protein [Chitinolyticbacter meiyuanensis]